MTKSKKYVQEERVRKYLRNLDIQLEDLEKLSTTVTDASFFTNPKNRERTKAIKFSLACAIQDVTRIVLHIVVALGLGQVKNSERDAILALSSAGIIPKGFAEKLEGMPSFRTD